MTRSLLLAALVAFAAPVGAFAQSQPTSPIPTARPDPTIAAMDTNHDGGISRQEARAARERAFDRLDTNKDGRLTAPERQAARSSMGLDPNIGGTDTITRQQFLEWPYALIDRADVNKDGVASAAELAALRQSMD